MKDLGDPLERQHRRIWDEIIRLVQSESTDALDPAALTANRHRIAQLRIRSQRYAELLRLTEETYGRP